MVVVLVMAFLHNGHHIGMFVVMPIMAMVVAVVVVMGVVMAILFPLAGQGHRQCKGGHQCDGVEYFHG
jgi:hypothetical protein